MSSPTTQHNFPRQGSNLDHSIHNSYYYTTQAVRGPITKFNQSKWSIAGPIFSKYQTGHCLEWSRTCVFAVFAFFSRVINLSLTKLARDRTGRISTLGLFCTDLGPIFSQYGPHAWLIRYMYCIALCIAVHCILIECSAFHCIVSLVASCHKIKNCLYYYSFKILPRFWLVKTTRIFTITSCCWPNLQRILSYSTDDVKRAACCRLLQIAEPLASTWRQKCSPLQIIVPLAEKTWGRDCVI